MWTMFEKYDKSQDWLNKDILTCEFFLEGSDFHVMNSGKYEKGWIEIKIVFFTIRIEWIENWILIKQ